MSADVTNMERAILDLSPTFVLRCTDYGVVQLQNSQVWCRVKKTPASGDSIVPSDGVFGGKSMRFVGGNAASPGNFISMPNGQVEISPKQAITLVLVMGDIRNVTPSTNYVTILGCSNGSGGYGFGVYSDGKVWSYVYLNNVAYIVKFDRNLLNANRNIIHHVCDGRYSRTYLNGELQGSVDAGSVKNITYDDSYLMIGCESDTGDKAFTGVPFLDADIALFAVYGSALSATQIASQYASFSGVKNLAGTAVLEDGRAASSVVIVDAVNGRTASVQPSVDGRWSASVPAGNYVVTTVGPAGYQPVTHGPVIAAAST